MKLYTVIYEEKPHVCVGTAGGQLAMLPYPSMNDLLADDPDRRSALLNQAYNGPGTLFDDLLQVVAPIPEPRQDIICLGMNYIAHKAEAEQFDADAFTRDKKAVYFSKRATHCPGPGDPIPGHFNIVEGLDYETELAVILGKDAKNVPRGEVFDYVFGYTIINDVSARNLQTGHKQWTFGKGLDGFAPMGPCIVTKDEFGEPPNLQIRTFVNGDLRQNAMTNQLIFTIVDIIYELSRGMTLKAGTIIATGTPSGVGMGFDPPRFLKPGDVVRCEIEGIGALENTVTE